MTAPARALRLCDVCGALDDAPRHVRYVPADFPGAVPDSSFFNTVPDGTPASAIAEVMDPTTVVRHMSCCADGGCGVCQGVLAAVGNVEGQELIDALVGGAVDNLGTAAPATHDESGEPIPGATHTAEV